MWAILLFVLDFPYKGLFLLLSLALTKLTPFMILLVDGSVVQGRGDIVLMIWVGSTLQGRDIVLYGEKEAKVW
jgi:hypothetical protein